MTKSKAEKKRNAQLHSDNYVSGKLFKLQDKLPTITELERNEHMRHLHKNLRLSSYDLNEGDSVCIVKVKPSSFRRKKYKNRLWKVDYVDKSNGFCQLSNFKDYDKERAEKNLKFIRSHNFSITDIWDLAGAFTLFFLPRLKVYIETERHGHPADLYLKFKEEGFSEEEATQKAADEWERKLNVLYDGLTLFYDGPDAHFVRTKLEKQFPNIDKHNLYKEEYKLEREAMEIFKEHFFSLWD